MTDEQIEMLRRLIQDEIEVAGVDGMEHGVWGFMDSQLDKRWKQFQESFNEEQALKALDKLYQENDNGMKELANESND
jgi:phage tail tape-measure protein